MKLAKLALFLISMLSYSSISVSAYDFEINGIYYDKDTREDGTIYAVVSHHDAYKGNIVIPDSITYQNSKICVNNIDAKAFQYCEGLESVFIPKTIQYIGYGAFRGCI